MKRVLFCYLLLLLSACNQAGENNTNGENTEKETAQSTETIIAGIDKEIESINQNLAAYKMETSDIMGESTEGGELKRYTENGVLKKASATYYGEMGKLVEEYYFSGDKVLFVLTQQYAYDRPISVEGSQVKSVEENRYYFLNEQIISWLDTNKAEIDQANYEQKTLELLEQVKAVKE